ncbi:MAG: tetratricopeptide repeat protein [bacterium]
MFIHLTKDYLKKLEEIDRRLEFSLDKEEIQTLGLKLRFYYNEIKHYRGLLDHLFNRVLQVQEKYGFSTEDEAGAKADKISAISGGSEDTVGGETKLFKEFVLPGVKKVELSEQKATEDKIKIEEMINRVGTFLKKDDTAAPLVEKLKGQTEITGFYETDEDETDKTTGMGVGTVITAETQQQTSDESAVSLMEKLEEWVRQVETLGAGTVVEEMVRYLRTHRADMMMLMNEIEQGALPWNPEGTSTGDFICGVLFMAAGRDGTAINMFESAIKKGADYAEVNFLLGECLANRKLFDRALRSYRAALERDSSQPEAALKIADCLLRLERYEEAADMISGFDFKLKEHRVLAEMKRIEALIKINKPGEAFEGAKALAEECDTDAERSQCYYLMARAKEQKGDILSAIDLYEHCLEEDSANGKARLGLGKLYLHHRAIPLAKNHFTYIMRNFPDSAWADEARQLMYDGENLIVMENETVSS